MQDEPEGRLFLTQHEPEAGSRRSQPEATPLRLTSKPHFAEVSFEAQDLALYDELFDPKENPHAKNHGPDAGPGQG